jgi:hypothetical protein
VLGVKAWAVEANEGPWLERALSHGCRAMHVPFDEHALRFEDERLTQALTDAGVSEVDLIFVDSPVGTTRRRNVLRQLAARVRARWVLYHDALRDAVNIYADQQAIGLRLVQWFDTSRGLVLFEMSPSTEAATPVVLRPFDALLEVPRVRPTLLDVPAELCAAEKTSLRLELTHTGAGERFASRFAHPVHLSYHWLRGGQVAVWDGLRTQLPHDMFPGDRTRCLVDVHAPPKPGTYQLQVTLVQEGVCWFHERDPGALALHEVTVR